MKRSILEQKHRATFTNPMPQTPQRFPLESLILDTHSAEPLYRQLEQQLHEAIQKGWLHPGERLPSTRQLAQALSISRNTANAAYEQLGSEGYLQSRHGSGTRVADQLPEQLLHSGSDNKAPAQNQVRMPLSRIARDTQLAAPWILNTPLQVARPFRPHVPASNAFPRKIWARLNTQCIRRLHRDLLERVDPRGYPPLRAAIADYLKTARNLNCSAGQLMITAGTQQAIEMLAKLFIEPGDVVCMEDPGYQPAGIVFEWAGAEVVPIPVDEHGIRIDELERLAPKAKLVYVTPSGQFPLGMTMPLERRHALLDWAARRNALILEDDYNGEYRYAGRPIPAIYRLAPPGRVIYLGSFSKLLFPALRLGYAVIPDPDIIDYLGVTRWLIDRHSPPLEQAVLTDFINQGHFARHIRRMRTLYAERRQALVAAAERHLQGILHVPDMESGLHLVGWAAPGIVESELLEAAEQAGVELSSVAWFSKQAQLTPCFILGYAPYEPKELEAACIRLREHWQAQIKSTQA